jgi:hypothetical protein
MQAVRQVLFTDVLIVVRHDVDDHSFAPIGLHKTDAASDWLLIKRHCIDRKGLPGVVMSNQRFFKIVCFRFPTNVPKKIEHIHF